MSDSLSRAFVSDIEVRSGGDGRTIHGIIVPFDRVATVSDGGPAYKEMFARGAFARTIQHRGTRVPLLSHHNARTNPLGRASLLREDASGLYGEFHVSKTRAGDEALELVNDGALDSFSVGFKAMQKRMEGDVTVRTEVGLREASLVTFPAYEGALVGGVRLDFDTIEDVAARLIEAGYLPHELVPTTPHREDTEASDTAPAPVAVEPDPAPAPLRSAHQIRLAFVRAMRERGVA